MMSHQVKHVHLIPIFLSYHRINTAKTFCILRIQNNIFYKVHSIIIKFTIYIEKFHNISKSRFINGLHTTCNSSVHSYSVQFCVLFFI